MDWSWRKYIAAKAGEESKRIGVGGAGGTRTRYLFNAIEALSLMSYSPTKKRTPEDVQEG